MSLHVHERIDPKRLASGTMLVLEVKGQDSPQNQAKRVALDEWTRAVTQHGGFGRWGWAVSRAPSDVADVVHGAQRSAGGAAVPPPAREGARVDTA